MVCGLKRETLARISSIAPSAVESHISCMEKDEAETWREDSADIGTAPTAERRWTEMRTRMSEVIVRMDKVPKNCDDSCWGYLSGECPWSDHVDGYKMDGGRPQNCPIIGVLPEQHGDLIDGDALKKQFVNNGQDIDTLDVIDIIKNAPIIIAAERKDDEQADY